MRWHKDEQGLGSGERGIEEGPDQQDRNNHVGQGRQWQQKQQCTIVVVRIVSGHPALHLCRGRGGKGGGGNVEARRGGRRRMIIVVAWRLGTATMVTKTRTTMAI
jgi:hypothetical protein